MAKEKPPEMKWVCVSNVGLVVPTPEGGSRTLKRGDWVEGDFYEEVAARLQSLVNISEMDKDLQDRLEMERERRSGKTFPEEFQRAAAGEDPEYDPRFDKPPSDAAGNLGQIVQEATGTAKRSKIAVASSKPPARE